jgi:putative PEP-CTERM system TPR-repeat lipoprotein
MKESRASASSGPRSRRFAWIIGGLALLVLVGVGLYFALGDSGGRDHLATARTLASSGDRKGAIIELKNALQKDADLGEARLLLGELHYKNGHYAAAEKELRRARQLGQRTPDLDAQIADALLRQGEFQRVLDDTPIPADNLPDAPRARLLAARGNALLGLDRADEGRKLLLQALELDAGVVEAHLGLARLAIAQGQGVVGALGHIEAALAANAREPEPWVMKADLLRATGDAAGALDAYTQALKLDAEHHGARLAMATLLIQQGKVDAARAELDKVRKLAPDNLLARYVNATLLYRQKQYPQAREELQRVLQATPNHLPSLLLSGAVHFALGEFQTAATQLGEVVKAMPRQAYARKMLAATLLQLGRNDAALEILAALDPEHSDDPQVLALAGEIQMRGGDAARAAGYLERAARHAPDSAKIRTDLALSRLAQGDERALVDLEEASDLDPGFYKADAVLVLSHLRRKAFDPALAAIAELEKKLPGNPLTHNLRGAALLGKKDEAGARRAFEQALKLKPGFYPAAANLAQLDLKAGKPDAARKRFEAVLAADPANIQTMMSLAGLARRAGKDGDYVDWLAKAAKADAKALEPRAELARWHIAKQAPTKALALAREAAAANPDSLPALDLLGAVQMAAGEKNNALSTFSKLAELAPKSPVAQFQLGNARAALGQTREAREAFGRALELKPDYVEAQAALVALDIQEGRAEDALKIARAAQKAYPKSAAGWLFEGDALMAGKQYAPAADAYAKAYALASNSALGMRLHDALTRAGRVAEGDAKLLAHLKAAPKDNTVRLYLAESFAKRGEHARAVEQYRVLYAQAKNNAVVVNNLAWSLFQLKDPQAVKYAEYAVKLMPDNPATQDTLGWILTQTGQAKRGAEVLRQALSRAPDAGEIHYHLAYALAQSGDKSRAIQELTRLLDSGVAFSQEAQARELLSRLKSGG